VNSDDRNDMIDIIVVTITVLGMLAAVSIFLVLG